MKKLLAVISLFGVIGAQATIVNLETNVFLGPTGTDAYPGQPNVGSGKAINYVSWVSNSSAQQLDQGNTLSYNFNTMPGSDRTTGTQFGGVPWWKVNAYFNNGGIPIKLDTDNDRDFTDETAMTGFSSHGDTLITMDLAKIRSDNGWAANQALSLSGWAGVMNIYPGADNFPSGETRTNISAAILLDGLVLGVYDFSDQGVLNAAYHMSESYNLSVAGTGQYLSFVALSGLDNAGHGTHVAFGDVQLTEAVVPEPSTIFLLAVGGAITYSKLRRK